MARRFQMAIMVLQSKRTQETAFYNTIIETNILKISVVKCSFLSPREVTETHFYRLHY
jgi:hypothetical protein